jgi:hypothetical protein
VAISLFSPVAPLGQRERVPQQNAQIADRDGPDRIAAST